MKTRKRVLNKNKYAGSLILVFPAVITEKCLWFKPSHLLYFAMSAQAKTDDICLTHFSISKIYSHNRGILTMHHEIPWSTKTGTWSEEKETSVLKRKTGKEQSWHQKHSFPDCVKGKKKWIHIETDRDEELRSGKTDNDYKIQTSQG